MLACVVVSALPALAGAEQASQPASAAAGGLDAGAFHTCALLHDGRVRCWGYSAEGQLGYGNTDTVGDDETPASAGPVKVGAGRTAKAISAGDHHTCAILDNGSVRCWGYGRAGRLGYGNTGNVGDKQTPQSTGPVNLGPGRTAQAISAGGVHTCALLDDGSVLCWGYGALGQLGYGNTDTIDTPSSLGPVDLGSGRTASAITAGQLHTCAILDDGSVRCWGFGNDGRLGYANTKSIGQIQTPGSRGTVDLGAGRTATAISAGQSHTCARLDNGKVLCWGAGANGRLGYCHQNAVGAKQTPGSEGTVNLARGDGGVGCKAATGAVDPRVREARRERGFRSCLGRVAHRPKHARGIAHRECLRRYGRTPGRVVRLHARAASRNRVVLLFGAPGTDGSRPPAARRYLVKQSFRPIRSTRDPAGTQTLCHGSCRFAVVTVGTRIRLTVTNLRPHTRYFYAVTARDNVSGRPGPRASVNVKTR